MDKMLKIAVLLTAVDQMSKVIKQAVGTSEGELKKLQERQNKLFAKGGAMTATGVGIVASLAPAVQAFADLEEASLRLKSAMMGPGGIVSELFPKVNGLAEQLGDRLPGTTADFYSMFEVMLNNGVKAETILNGVGEAAAYLAVSLKMPYDEAGRFAAKMKEATGIADQDMLKFMDTISRVRNLGVEAGEMQYAFGRSAGSLKLLGLQGIEASKSISNVYAQLIRAGLSGETVGTGFATIINSLLDPKKMKEMNEEASKLGVNLQFFKDGKFMGVENMIAQFDKLRGFNAQQRASVVNALTGGGQDAQMLQTLINNGVEGFNKMNKAMAGQATLSQKVNSQLSGLKALWEATTGTITNLLAAFGEGIAPALKPMVEMLGKIAGWLKVFLAENPRIAQFIGMFIAATGVFITVMGVINLVKGAFIALRIVMMANPFILVAMIAIAAISLIYANWDRIKAFFVRLWDNVKAIFWRVVEWIKNLFLNYTPQGLIFKHWDKITAFFSNLWENVKAKFWEFVQWFIDLHKKFFEAGGKIVDSIADGIKAKWDQFISFWKGKVQEVRDFLPFSPAKTGPLKDIHKIRLVETIADSLKPNALVQSMQRVTQAVFNVNPNRGPQMALAGGGGGGVTVQMNISVSGGATAGAANSFIAELRKNKGEIARIIQEAEAQRQRRSF